MSIIQIKVGLYKVFIRVGSNLILGGGGGAELVGVAPLAGSGDVLPKENLNFTHSLRMISMAVL